MIAVYIAGNNSNFSPVCGHAYGSPVAGTELQLNDVVGIRRITGYRFHARDVWRKISVKIINREPVNRGSRAIPSDEDFRIIGTCRGATKE